MATSVPAPMAMPTSARASAGASLTPSPTIATLQPAAPAARRPCASLSSGSTSAKTSSMPSSAADRVGDLAGVAGDHHDARRRGACSSSTACARLGPDLVLERERADDLRRRARRRAPTRPAPRHVRRPRRRARPGLGRPRSRSSAGPPTATAAPSTVASTPRPVSDRKSLRRRARPPRRGAAATMARASGCSLSASTAAGQRAAPRRRVAAGARRRR